MDLDSQELIYSTVLEVLRNHLQAEVEIDREGVGIQVVVSLYLGGELISESRSEVK